MNNDDREVLGSQTTDIDQTAASILHNTDLTVAKPTYGKPYLGPDHLPVPTKGVDGSLQLTDTCAYCKNPGYLKQKCVKLHQKIRKQGNDPYKELGLAGN